MRVIDLDERTIRDTIAALVSGTAGPVREYANGRVEGDVARRTAYSYGRHFPLFHFIPRTYRVNDDTRRPPLFVINGDRWGGSRTRTPEHQSITRAAILATGLDALVLPFSALDGAGMLLDSIRPLHVRPDITFEETVERRTLGELPRWRRTYGAQVPRFSRTLDPLDDVLESRYIGGNERNGVPASDRWLWRERTASEGNGKGHMPIIPDADGMYRWTETVQRDTLPDADGIYRWTETRHRLGDALFTAEREVTERRTALPFESERNTARDTVTLTVSGDRSTWCAPSDTDRHVAGPSAQCVHCGNALDAIIVYRRRARYLSSFDYHEPAPLYFLCEVPRTGARTVDGAIDSLAPRAVHAALLAGKEVRRQGDIFLIDTALDRDDLVERGATFGRFTQWSSGAVPRAGEVTYRAPISRERETALRKRETAHARRLWRDTFRPMALRAETRTVQRAETRAANRALWDELRARHADEIARYGATALTACEGCSAAIGIPCPPIPADFPIERLRGTACNRTRYTFEEIQRRERDELKRTTQVKPMQAVPPHPVTAHGARARWTTIRDRHEREVALARASLRLAVFGRMPRGNGGSYCTNTASARNRRASVARAVKIARESLERIGARGSVDNYGHTCNAHARDDYRARYGNTASALWSRALDESRRKYRPETVQDTARARADREKVRTHLAVYGTAHTATEVARVGSAVYVRGTVRHAVDLETGRAGGPDHRPIVLTAGRWYLAVRNTVPRQNRRTRRTVTRTVSGQ